MMEDGFERCEEAAARMRENILRLANKGGANGAHIAPALSITEIMSVLFINELNLKAYDIFNNNRDVFILSKGHGALAYYASLYEAGIITLEELYTYESNGGSFPGQPSKNIAFGIDFSGGSLGLGLSYGAGIAVGNMMTESDGRVFVMLGDGELNEGSIWEAAMFIAHNKLTNIIAIVDNNEMQSDGFVYDILSIDIKAVWESFGWEVLSVDGHDVKELAHAFSHISKEKPTVIIAKTVKGKGVSFMENNKEWHHNRLSDTQLVSALSELEAIRHAKN